MRHTGIITAAVIAVAAGCGVQPAATTDNSGVCPGNHQPPETWTGTVTAPPGFLIVSICLKAGAANQGDGPFTCLFDPPVASGTCAHPSGKALSHWSFTITPEAPPSTTTPESSVPPSSTASVPPSTVPETTSSVPETSAPPTSSTTPTTTATTPPPPSTSTPPSGPSTTSTPPTSTTPGTPTTSSPPATTSTSTSLPAPSPPTTARSGLPVTQ